MITAQTVREALAELGIARSVEVADHLKVKKFRERRQVRQILDDLVKNGGAINEAGEDGGTYRLTDKPGRGGVQAKLWEFACLRFATAKPFSAAEAARLAECDRDYTKRYCRWLWNAGYLAICARGRAGALLYQVVGGKEHESAPPWNRRAEKRKSRGQGPVASGQKECKDWNSRAGCMGTPQTCTRACPIEADPPAETPAPLATSPQERFNAVLAEFGQAMVEIAGSCHRAQEIIRQMQDEIQAVKEQGHGEPADGHH